MMFPMELPLGAMLKGRSGRQKGILIGQYIDVGPTNACDLGFGISCLDLGTSIIF